MYENAVKGLIFLKENKMSPLFARFLECIIATNEKKLCSLIKP